MTIISVDDTYLNLIIIEEVAKDMGFDIISFQDPVEALEYIKTQQVDLMFVDYMMPKMNGLEFIQASLEVQEELIPIMVTAVNDDKSLRLEALNLGAADFLTKPVDIAELQAKIKNFTKIIQLKLQMKDFNEKLKDEVSKATKELVDREHEALQVISRLAEYRDPETGSHISRVAYYSELLAKEYGLSEKEQDILIFASPLHDIGKVGIRDNVLLKPGKLDADEFDLMKTHSSIGSDILKNSQNPYLKAGAIISSTHHEKYDGSGYPAGIKGEDIHIYGRITALADVFDALTSERPYKKAWSFEETIEFLKNQSGKHFDPLLVELFVNKIDAIREIYLKFKE
ncbi:MAG: HD domain-containing phosphohydrolase [Campylobacterota bacterium]